MSEENGAKDVLKVQLLEPTDRRALQYLTRYNQISPANGEVL